MSPEIAERAFKDAIECGLLQHLPDACAGDATAIGETAGTHGVAPGTLGPTDVASRRT